MAHFVRTQEVEHAIGPRGRFALRVTSPEVEIRGTDNPVARARITFEISATSDEHADEIFERARFVVRAEDGLLEISEPPHGELGLAALVRLFGKGRSTTPRVEVQLPRGASIDYVGVSGDLTATNLTGSQRYVTVSGDLVLEDVSGELALQGVSADVSLRSGAPVSLEAKTVSGDVSAAAPLFSSVRVVTVSGDVEIEGSLEKRHVHRVETVSGDLSLGVVGGLTMEVRGLSSDVDVSLPHRSEGSRERRRYVVGDGAAQLHFSSMSGDLSAAASRRVRATAEATQAESEAPREATANAYAGGSRSAGGGGNAADDHLSILRALERGEIDVDEAARRLGEGR